MTSRVSGRLNAPLATVLTAALALCISKNFQLHLSFLVDLKVTLASAEEEFNRSFLRNHSNTTRGENETTPREPKTKSLSTAVTANQTVPYPFDNNAQSKYAYAVVIGGCNPVDPAYLGFLYNVLVSTRVLRDEGSKADFVLFVQMAYQSPTDRLPAHETRMLEAMSVHIRYLPKSEQESFYETVLNKFQILDLTEYRRVLLMDGDVMPLVNLDYMFRLSDGPDAVWKENVVINGPWEPANAGFFMLEPGPGRLDHIRHIIAKREEDAEHLLSPDKFDEVNGWGHVIKAPDKWVGRNEEGTNWTFNFAYSDQGLLYHWTKYVQKSVSIVMMYGHTENWSESANGTVHLEDVFDIPLSNYSKPRVYSFVACKKFLCDISHFSGKFKPWMMGPPGDLSEATRNKSGQHLWFDTLEKLNDELQIGLNFSDWKLKGIKPPLGLWTRRNQMNKRVFKRALDKKDGV